MTDQSFIVVESGQATGFERACADLVAATGVPLIRTFARPGAGTIRAGEVTDESTAQQAVLAAVAGAHLVVAATAPREVTDMLCDDLRRLGTLEHRVGPVLAGTDPASVLSLDHSERLLIERLLAGDSLGEAARALHLSRRTADRRLASARRALGAATTAEALATAVAHGLRPPPT